MGDLAIDFQFVLLVKSPLFFIFSNAISLISSFSYLYFSLEIGLIAFCIINYWAQNVFSSE